MTDLDAKVANRGGMSPPGPAKRYATIVRAARSDDVADIVRLLADDPLGAARETDPGFTGYRMAFEKITADPHQKLVVGERGGEVVACLQLTFIPGLSRRGMTRALIEAVRVRADQRGGGIGRQLIGWAVDEARRAGCGLVQLTTDKTRVDAHRFYESLGFQATHVGMKLTL